MKRLLFVCLFGAAGSLLNAGVGPMWTPTPTAGAPAVYPPVPRHVIEEWRDLRFGMFVCWGPVTLTGKEIGHSREIPPDGKQRGLRCALRDVPDRTPIADYDSLYKKWKPANFDAGHWVSVAREAGMKYLIFLVKHHDGFCLYDTKLTDYRITAPDSAWQTDVLRAVADACHQNKMKLIVYYSQPDWHHPDYFTPHHERYIEYLHGQVREILTHYGQIDGLWFDGLWGNGPRTVKLWDAPRLFQTARALQPNLIINNRCGLAGDFDTPENRIGFYQVNKPWETCTTLMGQWSWRPDSPFFRSREECVRMLVSVAIGGGNLALGIGPMPDGRVEPRQVERLREIGRWLEQYGESIYSTRGGPFVAPDEKSRPPQHGKETRFELAGGRWWGGSTHRDDTLYLHVMRWPDETLELPDIGLKLIASRVLTGGDATITQSAQGTIRVSLPPEQRDPLDTIIRLQFDGPITKVKVKTGG